MPSGPPQPPSPERPQSAGGGDQSSAASGERDSAEREPEERSGPLTVTRFVKDDGRSLILYSHDESSAELGDATAREPQRGDDPQ